MHVHLRVKIQGANYIFDILEFCPFYGAKKLKNDKFGSKLVKLAKFVIFNFNAP